MNTTNITVTYNKIYWWPLEEKRKYMEPYYNFLEISTRDFKVISLYTDPAKYYWLGSDIKLRTKFGLWKWIKKYFKGTVNMFLERTVLVSKYNSPENKEWEDFVGRVSNCYIMDEYKTITHNIWKIEIEILEEELEEFYNIILEVSKIKRISYYSISDYKFIITCTSSEDTKRIMARLRSESDGY